MNKLANPKTRQGNAIGRWRARGGGWGRDLEQGGPGEDRREPNTLNVRCLPMRVRQLGAAPPGLDGLVAPRQCGLQPLHQIAGTCVKVLADAGRSAAA